MRLTRWDIKKHTYLSLEQTADLVDYFDLTSQRECILAGASPLDAFSRLGSALAVQIPGYIQMWFTRFICSYIL